VERLWISSLTPDAIQKGFDKLRPGPDYDPLADAARGRSRADWLVGMNLSRAYSLAYREDLSVGRVQTPTLAMVVERELAIRAFVPEIISKSWPRFLRTPKRSTREPGFVPRKPAAARETRLPPDGKEAGHVVERARTGAARIESIDGETGACLRRRSMTSRNCSAMPIACTVSARRRRSIRRRTSMSVTS